MGVRAQVVDRKTETKLNIGENDNVNNIKEHHHRTTTTATATIQSGKCTSAFRDTVCHGKSTDLYKIGVLSVVLRIHHVKAEGTIR